MPASKSARVQERRRVINRLVRTRSRTAVKRAVVAISSGPTNAATVAVTSAISALDRAAAKGIIHKNNAARRKSRLARRLNAATAE